MAVKIKTLEYFIFSIGGYPGGHNQIRISENLYDIAEYPFDHFNILPAPTLVLAPILKKELIGSLNDIQVANWQRKYSMNDVLDGTEWELEIKYNNRKTSKIVYGSNEYPYVDRKDGYTVKSKILDQKPDFIKLLSVLNKIAKKKNYFY